MNFIKKVLLLTVILSLTTVVACSNKDKKADVQTAEPVASGPSTQTVRLQNFQFVPTNLVLQVGDTVIFQNVDGEARRVVIPPLNIDQVLETGKTWTFTFSTAGEFQVQDPNTAGNPTMTISVH